MYMKSLVRSGKLYMRCKIIQIKGFIRRQIRKSKSVTAFQKINLLFDLFCGQRVLLGLVGRDHIDSRKPLMIQIIIDPPFCSIEVSVFIHGSKMLQGTN